MTMKRQLSDSRLSLRLRTEDLDTEVFSLADVAWILDLPKTYTVVNWDDRGLLSSLPPKTDSSRRRYSVVNIVDAAFLKASLQHRLSMTEASLVGRMALLRLRELVAAGHDFAAAELDDVLLVSVDKGKTSAVLMNAADVVQYLGVMAGNASWPIPAGVALYPMAAIIRWAVTRIFNFLESGDPGKSPTLREQIVGTDAAKNSSGASAGARGTRAHQGADRKPEGVEDAQGRNPRRPRTTITRKEQT